jgi:dihydroorotate dehydrogenase electron transfer subunit
MPERADSHARAPQVVVLTNLGMRGDYGLLRLTWPKHIPNLSPGHALQLHTPAIDAVTCAPLFRCDPRGDWCEVLYRSPSALSQCKPTESIGCSGVIGNEMSSTFTTPQKTILLGSGLGLAPIVFFADLLRQRRQHRQSIALLEFDDEAPFVATPSRILLPTVPNGVIACMPLLEDWGIASRLASTTDQPGTFDGGVLALADHVLGQLRRDNASAIAFVVAGTDEFVEQFSMLREKYRIQPERVQVCALAYTITNQ